MITVSFVYLLTLALTRRDIGTYAYWAEYASSDTAIAKLGPKAIFLIDLP